MKKIIFTFVILLLTDSLLAIEPHFMQDPAISPDGNTICFAYMSDLWLVPFHGGEAKRLTVSKGTDSNPVFSPDGKTIAFNSNRDGFTGIYIIPSEGGKAECISKEGITVVDWFKNGKKLLGCGYQLPNRTNFMEVPLDGTHPALITEIGSSLAQLSPDNKKIIFSYRGDPTRERYTGSHNGQLWEYNIKEKSYTQLTHTEYTERYPVYSYVNDRIYFSSADFIKDNLAVLQLYFVENYNFDDAQQLSDFNYWSARQLSIARENDNIVFTLFDELWSYEGDKGKIKKVPIEIKQDFLENMEVTEEYVNMVSNFSISPNGKMVAFTYKYDLFAMPEKGGEVKQLTFSQKGIGDIAVTNDNQSIYFTTYDKGNKQLYKINISEPENLEYISWFKDAYVNEIYYADEVGLIVEYSGEKEKNNIALLDPENDKVEVLINDQVVGSSFVVSPDQQYALYFELTPGTWDEILYLYNFETKERTVLYPYHGNMHSPLWGKHGSYIFFNRDEDICRMDLHAKEDFWDYTDYWEPILNPEDEEKKEEDKDKKEKEDNNDEEEDGEEKDKKDITISIDLEDIRKRVKVIATHKTYNYIVGTDEDSTLYYVNLSEDDTYTLRKVDYEGKDDQEITSFYERPRYMVYNEENDCFYCVVSNSMKKITKSGSTETLENEFCYTYNKSELNKTIFEQAWRAFQIGFYDPNMHDINWEKSYKKYSPYMEYAYTPEVMDYIYSEMMGEVNASHTGFYARQDNYQRSFQKAYGGFTLDYSDIPKKGIKFKQIFRKSKLNKPHEIKPGDVLLSVDGEEIESTTPINPLFFNKEGEKIRLEIQTADSIATVEIKGLSWWQHYSMWYDDWVSSRREMVDELSDGRFGYAHIRSMGWSPYEDFVQDVFANNWQKEALIIDVRNNPGGWIHDWLIELLTKEPYAFTTNRIFNVKKVPFPGDTWTKPTILLINQNSFSDAEIFPNIYQHFKLGKVIGMPTSGSVIGTGHKYFMDGSSMRMPGTGWYTADEVNMEGTGAKPDIYLDQTFEEKIEDNDVQLKRAVEELMKEIQ
ncbi:MAG TPA: DNA primase [Candidatus Cloacimonetes bacterium]|nr:DNA primase [Candidatus Cloacimonadota bacterium]HEX38188.1 DNA primase [Candidatus Cloacimonadota bacterium]